MTLATDSKEDFTQGKTAEMDVGAVAMGPCREGERWRDSLGKWDLRAEEQSGGWGMENHQQETSEVRVVPANPT